MRAGTYYAAGMVLCSALTLQALPGRYAADAPFQDSFRLVKDTHPARKLKESDDRNTDDDFSTTTSSPPTEIRWEAEVVPARVRCAARAALLA